MHKNIYLQQPSLVVIYWVDSLHLAFIHHIWPSYRSHIEYVSTSRALVHQNGSENTARSKEIHHAMWMWSIRKATTTYKHSFATGPLTTLVRVDTYGEALMWNFVLASDFQPVADLEFQRRVCQDFFSMYQPIYII